MALLGAMIKTLMAALLVLAASALGQSEVREISTLVAPYCELLAKVWSQVGYVWENGSYKELPASM